MSARARPGRRGPSRLSRRLRLRPGFSEWGTQGQDAIAARLARLDACLRTWCSSWETTSTGAAAPISTSRASTTSTSPLIRECKAHVALGNHDLEGLPSGRGSHERWETCLQRAPDLAGGGPQGSLHAPGRSRKTRRPRRRRPTPRRRAPGSWRRRRSRRAASTACPATPPPTRMRWPGQADLQRRRRRSRTPSSASGASRTAIRPRTCASATTASSGRCPSSPGRGRWPIRRRPPPRGRSSTSWSWTRTRSTSTGACSGRRTADAARTSCSCSGSATRCPSGCPRPEKRTGSGSSWPCTTRRTRRGPAPAGSSASAWAATATSRGCATSSQKTLEDLEPPDIMFTAHNHIYARSHPLDPAGQPVTTGKGGVRYFVTGGGGAPALCRQGRGPAFRQGPDHLPLRLSAPHRVRAFYWTIDAGGQVRDSGCFDKGSNVDHPLSPDFSYDDSLPPRCAVEGG